MANYLNCITNEEHVDYLIVFGGKPENRVAKVLELYNKKLFDKVIFTGGSPSYMENSINLSEAEQMRDLAISFGIPEDKILLETESKNTVENVANLFKLNNFKKILLTKRIGLLASTYHLRRAFYTFIAVCNANKIEKSHWLLNNNIFLFATKPSIEIERYYLDKSYWEWFCNEYVKIYNAKLWKHF